MDKTSPATDMTPPAGGPVQLAVLADVCRRRGIRLAVLFGSHAATEGGLPPRPVSDVDLAVSFQRGAPLPAHFEVHDELAAAVPGRELDLAYLANADPLFRWEIMERGVRLYGDVDEFLELRAFAYRDFVDSADLRRLEYRLFARRMEWLEGKIGAAS